MKIVLLPGISEDSSGEVLRDKGHISGERNKLFPRLFEKKEKIQPFRIPVKGIAFLAAVESGILPEVEENGEHGYDCDLFEKFWSLFTNGLKENSKAKKSKNQCSK